MNAIVNEIGLGTVHANGHDIRYVDNGAGWRYATLLDKEPETIEWIDGFAPGETLWDIGANVGIYSVYAGVRGTRTMAFEPHFANYHQLCLNVGLNDLQDVVMPLCLAFTEAKAVAEMNLASIDFGTSMSNFGEALDFRGHPFKPAFRQGMIGYDVDSFIADFGVEVPDHLKIDVDGIELPIIRGARRTLADPRVKSVSIELIETDLAQVEAVTAILAEAGLQFVHKKQNLAFSTPETTDVLNFLYCRPAYLEKLTRIARRRAAEQAVVDADPVARIVNRVAGAAIDRTPSANIYMADMLSEALYAELLARLPADDALDPIVHPDAVTRDGRVTRRLLDLTPDTLTRFEEADRPFWASMLDIFTAPALMEAVVEKFRPELTARFGDAIPDLVAVPVLYRDYPGYRITIHPDCAAKIATLQFYLPADESQRHLGTSFHRRTGAGFVHHKTNAFLPNSAYAFVRTDESWHSVTELDRNERVRNTIALTFYIRGQEYSSAGMMDMMAQTPAPQAPDEELADALRALATTFTGPGDIASLFRADGIGVALGVGDGAVAAKILAASKADCLYAVDSWADNDAGHMAAVRTLNAYRDRTVLLRMERDQAIGMFSDNSLDFIFIDSADDGRTLVDWYAKLRPIGVITGTGYSPAVEVFAEACELELLIVECVDAEGQPDGIAWFAAKA